MKKILFLIGFFLGAETLMAFQPVDIPRSPRLANYDITATLDVPTNMITASEILHWKNHTNDTIHHLQFHLYLNAFKNNQSTFFKESGGQLRGIGLESENDSSGWGYIQIQSIKLLSINKSEQFFDLSNKLQYIQPDDNNTSDQTVAQIVLPKPVLPKGEMKLEIHFKSKLPNIFARTGYSANGNFFLVGQWFPKIGVYEGIGDRYVSSSAKHGQWNCHQFHGNSEFFADFGVYNVELTVPKQYIVGATGVLQSERENGDSKTLTFKQEDVHDFAWTASTLFQPVKDIYKSKDGHDIEILLLIQPQHVNQTNRHISAIKNTLDWAEEWLGVYPFQTITIVDPAYDAQGAGGMEYPTFITAGTFWNLPEGIKVPEVVTVHEFGHQYFQGILASNEFEEAWLDEGMNTWLELSVCRRAYGGESGKLSPFGDKTSLINLLGLRVGGVEFSRSSYTSPRSAKRDTIVKNVWTYDRGGYGELTYNKPGAMMLTLENVLGEVKMKQVMRTYYERFKFKHPTTRDFIAVVNEISGQEFDGFFSQFLYSTLVLDYSVQSITNEKPERIQGISADDKNSDSLLFNEANYQSKVVFARIEEAVAPMEILIRFSDGSEYKDVWDGKGRYKVYSFEKNTKVVAAYIDPDGKYLLDVNTNNNSLLEKPVSTGIWGWTSHVLFWLQNLLLLFV